MVMLNLGEKLINMLILNLGEKLIKMLILNLGEKLIKMFSLIKSYMLTLKTKIVCSFNLYTCLELFSNQRSKEKTNFLAIKSLQWETTNTTEKIGNNFLSAKVG